MLILLRINVSSLYKARQDTTKSRVNSHLPAVNSQAKYTFRQFRRTLALLLSLPVGDLLVWLRVRQNHTIILSRVVPCRAVPCRAVLCNVNRALFVLSVMPFLTCIHRPLRCRTESIRVVTNQSGEYKFEHLPSVTAVPDSKLMDSWDQEGLPSTGVDDGVPAFSVCWLTFRCLDTRLRSISRSPGRCDSHTDNNCKEGSDSCLYFSVVEPFLIADPATHLQHPNIGVQWLHLFTSRCYESYRVILNYYGSGSSIRIATDYGLDGTGIESRWGEISARPDRPWGPPNLLYNGYWVFPGVKVRPGRAADHSPPSSASVMEEYSYTSTHTLGHNRACNGNTLHLYIKPLNTRYRTPPPPTLNPCKSDTEYKLKKKNSTNDRDWQKKQFLKSLFPPC